LVYIPYVGVKVLPFVRGALPAVSVNLGSNVLGSVKITSDSRKVEIVKHSKSGTQGFGITSGGLSFEYDRNLSFGRTENIITLGYQGIGFKWNITNRDFIVGIMPSAGFSFILGGKAEVISGLKF
jgi:hypothetical protein